MYCTDTVTKEAAVSNIFYNFNHNFRELTNFMVLPSNNYVKWQIL